MGDDLTLETRGDVATITICREARRNALARRHFYDLLRLLDEAEAGPARVVVLTGEGDEAFCAGADLKAEEAFVETLHEKRTTGLGEVLRRARRLAKPLIGRINGHCYAGGVGLLAACDLAVTVDEARFALPEVKVGLFPFVVLAGLGTALPRGVLADLAFTGEPIDAHRAQRMGLVARCVPRDALDATIADLAAQVADIDANARAARAALSGIDDDTFEGIISQAERRTFAWSRQRHLRSPKAGA